KGATLQQVAEDVQGVLQRAGVAASSVGAVAVRVDAGRDEIARLIVRARLSSAADVARARTTLTNVRSTAGKDSLSYPGAAAIEVQLVSGTAAPVPVVLQRASAPPPPDAP